MFKVNNIVAMQVRKIHKLEIIVWTKTLNKHQKYKGLLTCRI